VIGEGEWEGEGEEDRRDKKIEKGERFVGD